MQSIKQRWKGDREQRDFTDDCQLLEYAGIPVQMVKGSYDNIKITTPEDLAIAQSLLAYQYGWEDERDNAVGHGYDVHRFEKGRKCIIGGVTIPFDKGLAGHSDADVLLHAIADALLGAAALGDIGKHFPDMIRLMPVRTVSLFWRR